MIRLEVLTSVVAQVCQVHSAVQWRTVIQNAPSLRILHSRALGQFSCKHIFSIFVVMMVYMIMNALPKLKTIVCIAYIFVRGY